MKWKKFDPENPPKYTPGEATFWLIRFINDDHYTSGAYLEDKGLLVHAGDGSKIDILIKPERLVTYNAHWIYPQDLEMPE